MPHYTLELPETYASITRPVGIDITKQLLLKLGIDNVIPILFPGANGKVSTWNSTQFVSQDSANFNTREHVLVNVKEEYIEDDLLTMYSQKKEQPPFFTDTAYNIYAHPIYSRTKVTISFTYRSRDRWQAESFRDNWRRKIAENREHMVFQAHYQYPIPDTITQIIYLLYGLRKRTNRDFKTWQDYLFGKGSKALTVLTNSIGKGDIVAVDEYQLNILGNMTDVAPPEAEKDDKGSTWSCNFDFEYSYDKPIAVNIHYPLMIDNQLVPEPLYPELQFDIQTLASKLATTRNWQNYIQNNMGYFWHVRGAYIRIPEFDDWSNERDDVNHKPLVSIMLEINPDDPRDICNLADLGEYQLIPQMIEAFKYHRQYLTLKYEAPYYIQLYENDTPLHEGSITIDEDLNIRTTFDMSIKKMYHLLLTIQMDIRKLSRDAEQRFFKNPATVYSWIDMRVGHPPKEGYPKTLPNGWVDFNEFRKFVSDKLISSDGNYAYHHPGRIWATLGIYGINVFDQTRLMT